jgi:hypothetical protein
MRIAICAPKLGMGGGQLMIVRYANFLGKQGHQVTLVLEEVWLSKEFSQMVFGNVEIVSSKQAIASKAVTYDIAIGTYWKTFATLFQLNAKAYCQFIQSLECRFFDASDTRSVNLARVVQELDIPAIVVADWIADCLASSNRRSQISTVLNGIDKAANPVSAPRVFNSERPLRVVIEGAEIEIKGFLESAQGVSGVSVPIDVSLFSVTGNFLPEALTALEANPLINLNVFGSVSQAEFYAHLCTADILVKSSRVEGMPGPPIEAFHAGCTGIYTDVTGIESYVEHGHNAVIVPFDSPITITNWIEILHSNRNLLLELQNNGISAAEKWPDAETSCEDFERELLQCYENYVASFARGYVKEEILPVLFDAITHERFENSYGTEELLRLRRNQSDDAYYLEGYAARSYYEIMRL